MQFTILVALEAEDAKAAANKIPPELTVISVNPRPQAATQGSVILSRQHSTTSTSPTPA